MSLPPADRRREIAELEKIYQAAFVALGIKTLAEGLDLHDDIPTSPAQVASAVTRFIDQVLKVAGLRRQHAYKITLPYYRLMRALWTGATIQEIEVNAAGVIQGVAGEATEEALSDLRSDFYRQVEALAPEAMKSRPKASGGSGDKAIVERIKDIEKKLNELDKLIDKITKTDLIGSNAKLIRQLKEIDRDLSAKEVDEASDGHKRQAGAKSAGIVEKSALDAGRLAVETIGLEDPKVLGFMRIHENPVDTPCGWCAMLLSRGIEYRNGKLRIQPKELYKSENGAQKGTASDGKYHQRCHCRAVPIYSAEDAENNPDFALNRQYAEEWPNVTRGLSGKQALSKWRRHIRYPNQ